MTQNDMIARHLRDYGSITSFEAFSEYGVTRLSARIHDLKHDGMNIVPEVEVGRNRYGDTVHYTRYSLEV